MWVEIRAARDGFRDPSVVVQTVESFRGTHLRCEARRSPIFGLDSRLHLGAVEHHYPFVDIVSRSS